MVTPQVKAGFDDPEREGDHSAPRAPSKGAESPRIRSFRDWLDEHTRLNANDFRSKARDEGQPT